jgi:D-amino-acid dehydrogenase
MKKVAIVGGGIIGCCSAYYLAKAGHQVQVLDKMPKEDESGCSFVNCGYLTPSHFVPLAAPGVIQKGLKWMFNKKSPLHIAMKWDKELFRWLRLFAANSNESHVERSSATMLALNLKSKQLYDEMIADGVAFTSHHSGLLVMARTEKGLHGEYEMADEAVKMGLKPIKLDRAALSVYEPHGEIEALGGVFYPEDGFFDPRQLLKALRVKLTELGVDFKHEAEVKHLSFDSDGQIAIHFNEDVIRCEHLVLAAGSWTSDWNEIMGIEMPLQAGKGYSMNVTNMPFKLIHPTILAEAKIAMTPLHDGVRIGGTMEINGRNLKITDERLTAIKDATSLYFPEIRKHHFRKTISNRGLRPLSPDGMPYIGNLRRRPNVTIATGHAMVGMSLGAVTGQMVARLVDGEETGFNMEILHPQRFEKA